jgi:hypothetical protein
LATLTHSGTIFLLGFATLFLSRVMMPGKICPLLGTVSGAGDRLGGGELVGSSPAGGAEGPAA